MPIHIGAELDFFRFAQGRLTLRTPATTSASSPPSTSRPDGSRPYTIPRPHRRVSSRPFTTSAPGLPTSSCPALSVTSSADDMPRLSVPSSRRWEPQFRQVRMVQVAMHDDCGTHHLRCGKCPHQHQRAYVLEVCAPWRGNWAPWNSANSYADTNFSSSEIAPATLRGSLVVMNHIGMTTGLSIGFWLVLPNIPLQMTPRDI